MKTIAAILAGAALAGAALLGVSLFARTSVPARQTKDEDGHVLSALWKEYKAAQAKDLPQDQLNVLEKIKKQAKDQVLAYDFWDASSKYVEVSVRRYWKLRESLQKALETEAMAFPDPIVGYAYLRSYSPLSEMLAYAKKHKETLSKHHNEEFYKGDTRTNKPLSLTFAKYIKNDYEYAFWAIALGPQGKERDEAIPLLKAIIGDSYPTSPYLDFTIADKEPDGSEKWTQGMKAIIDKYPGTAVALYPQGRLDYIRFWKLQDEKKSTETDYKALLADVRHHEAARLAMKGSEADMVRKLEDFIAIDKNLNDKVLYVCLDKGKARVFFRNVKTATLVMKEQEGEKKEVFRQQLTNPKNSFYVLDSLDVTIPDAGDGSFTVEVDSKEKGVINAANEIRLYSYALAVRRSADGLGVFAANAVTGLPLEKATLVVLQDKKEVARIPMTFGPGYTTIPKSPELKMYSRLNYYVEGMDAAGLTRRSPQGWIFSFYDNDDTDDEDKDDEATGYNFLSQLFLNTKVLRPGDTLQYKGLLFKYFNDNGKIFPVKKGTKVNIVLTDPEGDEIGTNENIIEGLGSFAGKFVLPKEVKAGSWSVSFEYEDEGSERETVSSETFYCGDYVLPTFECKFDKMEWAVSPEDSVHFKGTLTSLSGHKLSDATITYKLVSGWRESSESGTLKPDGNGRFDIGCIVKEGYNSLEIIVADATGETLQFQNGMYVSDYMNIDAELLNKADGYQLNSYMNVLTEDVARIKVDIQSDGLNVHDAVADYSLIGPDSKVVFKGKADGGSVLELNLAGAPDGIYALKTVCGTKKFKKYEGTIRFLKFRPGHSIPAGVSHIFHPGESKIQEGGNISFLLGSGEHPIWAVAELCGKDNKVLLSKTVFIPKGSSEHIDIQYLPEYGDNVYLTLLFFSNYSCKRFNSPYYLEKKERELPLKVTRFTDNAAPSSEVTVELESAPGSEAVASVWDKASDAIMPNRWGRVFVPFKEAAPIMPSVMVSTPYYGSFRAYGMNRPYDAVRMEKAYAVTSAAQIPVLSDEIDIVDDAIAEGISNDLQEIKVMGYAEEVVIPEVRSNFSEALYFEPYLRADADGHVRFSFKTSDKLSTYRLAVFAHDSLLRNNVVEKEFKVTIPVKVDVLNPEFLYDGDRFSLTATVSSEASSDLSGKLTVYQYDGADYRNLQPLSITTEAVTVPAGGVLKQQFPVTLSESEGPTSAVRGLLVSFKGDDGTTDAMFITVPVLERAQTLTESHSAVLLAGADKDALMKELQGRFTGTTAYGAVASEISVLDMVKEVLNGKLEEPREDVVSLTEALYVRMTLSYLKEISPLASLGRNDKRDTLVETSPSSVMLSDSHVTLSEVEGSLLERIFALQNEDGGFAWFKGFKYSPILTAIVLGRFHKMRFLHFDRNDNSVTLSEVEGSLAKAVKYLDANHFSKASVLYWCGGISDEQYMNIRAAYANVPFEAPSKSDKDSYKTFEKFKKNAAEYLTPEKARGLNGYIMAKARRLATLELLASSAEGKKLAKAWGVKTSAKIERSAKEDVASLVQYAVRHRDGGWYYPNAVMPWRGLLETEAYAHTILASLLDDAATGDGIRPEAVGVWGSVSPSMDSSDRRQSGAIGNSNDIANGIRLWLMLQKETQHWDTTPDFVDAVACILEGSKEVLDTKVLTLTKTYRKPFEEIVAAGNGFTIGREFFREVTGEGGKIVRQPMTQGETVHKGEKITAIFHVYNEENRSFVRLHAPREATLRPVNQISGHTWKGYREVRTTYTDWFFDSFPEEKVDIAEEYFVTQTGTFACGVPEIESLYAPHYRANASFPGVLKAE